MTIDEILERAKKGDAAAMVILGNACTAKEMNYDTIRNALSWYEHAAEAGSSEGAMQAVLLYKILAMTNEDLPDFKGAIAEYGKAIEMIDKVFQMRDISEDVRLSAKGEYRDLHYRTACCYYILEEYGMSLIFLNSIEFDDFQTILLRGLCQYELAQNEADWNEVSARLRSVEENILLCDPDSTMVFPQQVILTKGYICLSHMYYFGMGVPKDLKKGYEIVNLAYNRIPDERLKVLVADEWKRYR